MPPGNQHELSKSVVIQDNPLLYVTTSYYHQILRLNNWKAHHQEMYLSSPQERERNSIVEACRVWF